jgi:hypothetical protein
LPSTVFLLFSHNYKSEFTSYGSSINIIYKYPDFFPLILQQQLTTLDFVSYCGGSLGLFLGFSLISAIEIVYYCTLRILFRSRQSMRVVSEEASDEPEKKSYLAEAIGSSTIHGFNQITSKNRHIAERFV